MCSKMRLSGDLFDSRYWKCKNWIHKWWGITVHYKIYAFSLAVWPTLVKEQSVKFAVLAIVLFWQCKKDNVYFVLRVLVIFISYFKKCKRFVFTIELSRTEVWASPMLFSLKRIVECVKDGGQPLTEAELTIIGVTEEELEIWHC